MAALALVGGIVVGASLFWTAFQSPTTVGGGSFPTGNTPLGTFLAFGSPSEETNGADHWYNFSVESAGGNYRLNNLDFQAQTPGGMTLAAGAGWALIVSDAGGAKVAAYSMIGPGAGNWTDGGDHLLTSTQSVDILTTPENLSGDTWVALLSGNGADGGPGMGEVTVAIP